LLFPLCIAQQEFVKAKKRLGGFNENACSVVRRNDQEEEQEEQEGGGIVQSILERVNVFVVDEVDVPNDHTGDSNRKRQYRFAGCYRKDMTEEKMLITVSTR
jgi:hypothetical protein